MAEKEFLLQRIYWFLQNIEGGTESLESLRDQLVAMPDVARYPASGTFTMTGGEDILFTQSDTVPFLFLGGNINLMNLAVGDTVVIKIYLKQVSGGVFRQVSDNVVNTYSGVQLPIIKMIEGFWNTYGVQISCTQSAGVNRDLIVEFYDGRRSS